MCAVPLPRKGLVRLFKRRYRRWSALYIGAVAALAISLYLVGLELWELWALTLLAVYLGWCLRQ